ncbi:hypothetical protein FBU30_009527 [Linnemannia zychae]|nr:hypothetical protein FBU30_009527 [Linnemannia zychae]
MKTPPYHCELQPIEKIWAVVKNIVASRTTGNMTPLGLKRMLVQLFFSIPTRIFISVWEKCIKIGYNYTQTIPDTTQSMHIDNTDEANADVNNVDFQDISNDYWLEVLKTIESYDTRLRIAVDSVEVDQQDE